ncbi:nickel pincer cofactor biosynthesis protein LarB [bacterium]|nr:nickel pincer cofactor biosynthesis protein LarB [bacterium]
MDRQSLEDLFRQVQAGELTPGEAADRVRIQPVTDLGFANIDEHRHLRCGFPEVIYCEGKTADQVVAIIAKLAEKESLALATRVSPEQMEHLQSRFPNLHLDKPSRIAWLGEMPSEKHGSVVVVTAGTSDLPVAREAELTAQALGCHTKLIADVGVAGIHRLLGRLPEITQADVVVVVAGMEGALPSVVGGLVDCPVIAVPTSIGYGANMQGISALLCMLTSCAANVTVVNIDAGFCGGFVAGLIARRTSRADSKN